MAKTMGAKTGTCGLSINKEEFEDLCSICCTIQEICDIFGVSHDTLTRWCKKEYGGTFTEVFAQKCTKGKVSLRRIQFEQAKTNSTMAIWLGKQILGQTDYVEQTNTTRIEVVNDMPKSDDDE